MHLNLLSRFTSEPLAIMEQPFRDFYAKLQRVASQQNVSQLPQIRCRTGIVGPLDFNGDPMVPQLEVVNGVGVIRVKGVLSNDVGWFDAWCGAYDYEWLAQFLDQALADRGVSTILLDLNSPGGSHCGMEETSDVVAAAAKVKPVLCFTSGLCASAAYRLACEAQMIAATPSAILGSIGSKFIAIDDSVAWQQAGYKLELFTSNGKGESSPLKGMLTPGHAMTDPERAFLKQKTDECAASFLAAVQARRPNATGVAFEGGWVFGTEAVTDQLIDATAPSLEGFLALLLAA